MPLGVGGADFIAECLDLILVQANVFQGAFPDRALQAARHVTDKFGGAGDTEHDADLVTVHVGEVTLSSVFKDALGDVQCKELRCVCRRDDVWRNTKVHGGEVHFRQEATAICIGAVRSAGIWIVVIVQKPVCLWHFTEEVVTFQNVLPEATFCKRTGEQRTCTNDGNKRVLRRHRLFP